MPYKKEFCLFLLEFKKYFISLHSVAGDTLQRKYQHDIIENNRSVMLDLPIGNLRNFLTERKRVWWFTHIAWAVYTIRAQGFSQDLL